MNLLLLLSLMPLLKPPSVNPVKPFGVPLLLPHLALHLPLKETVGNGTLKLLSPAHLNLAPKVPSSKREVTLEEESNRKFDMSFMSIP